MDVWGRVNRGFNGGLAPWCVGMLAAVGATRQQCQSQNGCAGSTVTAAAAALPHLHAEAVVKCGPVQQRLRQRQLLGVAAHHRAALPQWTAQGEREGSRVGACDRN